MGITLDMHHAPFISHLPIFWLWPLLGQVLAMRRCSWWHLFSATLCVCLACPRDCLLPSENTEGEKINTFQWPQLPRGRDSSTTHPSVSSPSFLISYFCSRFSGFTSPKQPQALLLGGNKVTTSCKYILLIFWFILNTLLITRPKIQYSSYFSLKITHKYGCKI